MTLKNQLLFDDLENTLNSTLEFLRAKDSIIKEMESELKELENEINFDLSKGLNVDKKELKLKDLEEALYLYEMKPSDILIECTHINNINNCIARISGDRIKTYGEAKVEYIKDLDNREKLTTIIKDMEKEFSKLKEENDIKKELRNKIVKSEMHLNGLNSRVKLYEDSFSAFIEKENELKEEVNKSSSELNSMLFEIEKDNKRLDKLKQSLNYDNDELNKNKKSLSSIEDKINELKNKSEDLGPSITNDISKLEEEKVSLEEEILLIKNNISSGIKEKRELEKVISKNKKELNKKDDNEPLINSNLNFINTQFNTLETYEDVNDLWKSKFSNFKDNVDSLAKENKYKYSNVNGETESPLNPLVEYTDRLKNMISFIQENDVIIDENDDNDDDTPKIVYREKEKESKLNPIVIGAIAIGGALILSKTK